MVCVRVGYCVVCVSLCFLKQTASTRQPGRGGDVHLGGLLRGLCFSVFLCLFKSRQPALDHQAEGGDAHLGGLLRGLCLSVF